MSKRCSEKPKALEDCRMAKYLGSRNNCQYLVPIPLLIKYPGDQCSLPWSQSHQWSPGSNPSISVTLLRSPDEATHRPTRQS